MRQERCSGYTPAADQNVMLCYVFSFCIGMLVLEWWKLRLVPSHIFVKGNN